MSEMSESSESDVEEESESYVISHWGEISSDSSDSSELPDISEDIKKAMDPECLEEFEDEDSKLCIDNLVLPPMDPLMMYGIQLHKWMNTMIDTIRATKLAIATNLIPPSDPVLPIPEMPDVTFRHKHNILNFMPSKEPLGVQQNEEVDVPEISRSIVEDILTKCIATILAHIGYETTTQSVIDVLLDVLNQFFLKVCRRFVEALREEETLNTGGFPNVLERTFVELGIGSTKDLNDYYQCRVLKYINVLQKRCKEMENCYKSLIEFKGCGDVSTVIKTEEMDLVFKIKQLGGEELELETDMKMDADNQSEIFTAGFQLLDSLEASTNAKLEPPDRVE